MEDNERTFCRDDNFCQDLRRGNEYCTNKMQLCGEDNRGETMKQKQFTIYVNDMKDIMRHPSTKKPRKDFYTLAWVWNYGGTSISSLSSTGYKINRCV